MHEGQQYPLEDHPGAGSAAIDDETEFSEAMWRWARTESNDPIHQLTDGDLAEIRASSVHGDFFAKACTGRGDGAEHDLVTWPEQSSVYTFDPFARSWSALQGRTQTAIETTRQLWMAFEDLAVIQLELTVPEPLRGTFEHQIRYEDRGKAFRQAGWAFCQRLWSLEGYPGDPLGAVIAIHPHGSSEPDTFKPHLHILLFGIGTADAPPGKGGYPETPNRQVTDDGTVYQAIPRARDPETGLLLKQAPDPLHVPTERLGTYRELWRETLQDHYGAAIRRHLDGELETLAHPQYGYVRLNRAYPDGDGGTIPGWVRAFHRIRYALRDRLEDVDAQIQRVDRDTGTLWLKPTDHEPQPRARDLDAFTENTLEMLFGLPDRWSPAAWFGQLSPRHRAATLEDLGVPIPDDEPNGLIEELEQLGRTWLTDAPDLQDVEELKQPTEVDPRALSTATERELEQLASEMAGGALGPTREDQLGKLRRQAAQVDHRQPVRWIRADVTHQLETAIRAAVDGEPPPQIEPVDPLDDLELYAAPAMEAALIPGATETTRELSRWILEDGDFCDCGAELEHLQATRGELLEIYSASHPTTEPQDREPALCQAQLQEVEDG